MPVEVEAVAAFFVAGACDPPAIADVLALGVGQVARTKHVAPRDVAVGRFLEDGPPRAILIVGQVNDARRAGAIGQLRGRSLHLPAGSAAAPAVDDEADGLLLIRIAWAAENLDGAVIVFDGLLRQERHEELKPGLDLAAPLCRAGDEQVELAGVEIGRKADLLEIAPADDVLALLLGLSQNRHQYAHQQRNDGDHHQQLNQRKPSSFVHLHRCLPFCWIIIPKSRSPDKLFSIVPRVIANRGARQERREGPLDKDLPTPAFGWNQDAFSLCGCQQGQKDLNIHRQVERIFEKSGNFRGKYR